MASIFKRNGKGSYIIQYFDHAGKRREKSSRTTDKRTAERIAAKIEADSALRREGVVDARLEDIGEESRRTVESHLADFEAKLKASNRTSKHINSTIGYIRTITEMCRFTSVSDITADTVNQFASDMKDEGRSARTVQAYLAAIKGFTRWLAAHGKLSCDPLASIIKPNPKSDRRSDLPPRVVPMSMLVERLFLGVVEADEA